MKQTAFSIITTLVFASMTINSQAEENGKGNRMKLDKNGDKVITKEEAGQLWARMSALDKNGDGKIEASEFMRRGGGGSPGGKGQPGEFMKRIDKNGDGNISKEEAPEQFWARISKLDKDGDNVISKEEFAAMRPSPGSGGKGRGDLFAMVDKDKDGKIVESEAPKFWERLSKADRDGDGAVSKEEYAAARAYMTNAGKGGMKGKGKGSGQPGGPGAIFGKYDGDKDGKLSEEEVPAEMWGKLSRADENADGLVSKEELGSVYSKMRQMNPSPSAPSVPKRPKLEEDKKEA